MERSILYVANARHARRPHRIPVLMRRTQVSRPDNQNDDDNNNNNNNSRPAIIASLLTSTVLCGHYCFLYYCRRQLVGK
jgi:hypothetical protein